jgi:ribonuclease HI
MNTIKSEIEIWQKKIIKRSIQVNNSLNNQTIKYLEMKDIETEINIRILTFQEKIHNQKLDKELTKLIKMKKNLTTEEPYWQGKVNQIMKKYKITYNGFKPIKHKIINQIPFQEKTIEIYTDGSYMKDNERAGFAAVDPISKKMIEGIISATINNYKAELYRIYYVMKLVKEEQNLIIKTDAYFAILALCDESTKIKQNRKYKHVIKAILKKSKERTGETKIEYVEAHAGIYRNEMADKQAKLMTEKPDSAIKYIDKEGKYLYQIKEQIIETNIRHCNCVHEQFNIFVTQKSLSDLNGFNSICEVDFHWSEL